MKTQNCINLNAHTFYIFIWEREITHTACIIKDKVIHVYIGISDCVQVQDWSWWQAASTRIAMDWKPLKLLK